MQPFASANIKKPSDDKLWHNSWKYRGAFLTLTILRARLNEINFLYPSAVSYTDFLWRTSSTWALCSTG